LATRRATRALEFFVGAGALPSSAVAIQPISGIDPDAGLYRVEITGGTAPHAKRWEIAVAHGRRLLAHEMLGACRAMLDLARTHALDRVQFDRPIASFQAVRHRLAEALVAIEALAATLEAAADEPNATTALLAKATAGRTARTVATHCQQVLAGIGFTTEHPFHRYLKRTMLLDGLLGRADDLVVVAGRELLAMRRVPTLIEL
jgi:alkylation response protein AidB-like acyl-CoA dehydrogenase